MFVTFVHFSPFLSCGYKEFFFTSLREERNVYWFALPNKTLPWERNIFLNGKKTTSKRENI
jgi:hypothetical protein